MNYLFLTSFLVLNALLPAQNAVDILKTNAINLGDLRQLSDELYQAISPFEVIMVGEMHGTCEPAQFVGSLAQLIAEKEGSVSVVLEIPDAKMNLDRNRIDSLGLLHTKFFVEENIDGRNGQAWFNLILRCSRDKRIKLFFMDNNTTPDRDSSMYLEVKRAHFLFPENKILTLSGNIHNRLATPPGDKRMGTYVLEDKIHFQADKIMSINHMYKEGTMMNNIGNGLELRSVQMGDGLFSSTLPYDNYFCKTLFGPPLQYNYFFFTRNVQHSEPIQF